MPKQECLLACGAQWAVGKVRAEQGLHKAAVCHLRAALVSSRLAGRDAVSGTTPDRGCTSKMCHLCLWPRPMFSLGVSLISSVLSGFGAAFSDSRECFVSSQGHPLDGLLRLDLIR
jgi:hypothetical protein